MTSTYSFKVTKEQIAPVTVTVGAPGGSKVDRVKIYNQIHYTNEVGVRYGEAKISYYHTYEYPKEDEPCLIITQVITINYPTGVFKV